MQVDFLICGAQKAGTTSLDAYCRRHPDIGMSQVKELHFFDDDDRFQKGEPDYGRYHQSFPAGRYRIYGETTPVYMYWPDVPERIQRYNPAMKLVVLLRNPVDRAYSHWHMEYSRGLENLPFARAIREESKRLADAPPEYRRVWSYVDRGRYSGQLQRLWSLFGEKQVLVLDSDALRGEPVLVLERVSEFLDIPAFPPLDGLSLNTQAYSKPLPDDDRQFLLNHFDGEFMELERLLGWNLDHWRG